MSEKVKRTERVVALTKLLTDRPMEVFSLNYFGEIFGAAKSTLSEDLLTIKKTFRTFGLGEIETLSGAAGGVRYIPVLSDMNTEAVLNVIAKKLSSSERLIPGGFLYMTDVLFDAQLMLKAGEIIMKHHMHLEPDLIMTVETKGIPLGLMVARAFNIPLVTVRRESKVTEGPTVSINYVSGSRRIQTMSLPKRSIREGAKVLIVDDFMKAGGTAKGMVDLAHEFGATVVGTGVLVATSEPKIKLIEEYHALLILHEVDEHTKTINISLAR